MLTQIGEFQRLCHINRMEGESLVATLRHDWHLWFLPKVAPLCLESQGAMIEHCLPKPRVAGYHHQLNGIIDYSPPTHYHVYNHPHNH